MSNRTKPQKKILRILSVVAQTLDTLGDFTYNPYPYLYASLGDVYDRETINDAVDDLIGKGLVEGNNDLGLRITSVGAGVEEGLVRARQKKWDGKWRVVFFDIPEVQRDIRDGLRSELKRLGFGLWQRSAWLTPFDIAKELSSYLRKQGLSEVVQIIAGERVGELNDREFAVKIWPVLADINERYKKLLDVWKEEIAKESTTEERFEAATSLHDRYLDILAADPQLPSELLPGDWLGDEAKKLFKKLKSTLTLHSRS